MTARAKINREAQALDGVLADRLAPIQRAPRRVIGAGEDVRLQAVDPRVIAETKYAVVHFGANYGPAGEAILDRSRQVLIPARHRRGPLQRERAMASLVRCSLGLTPVHRLNARVNALGWENPSEKVMSVTERRGSSM
jgi:hypothetical protein